MAADSQHKFDASAPVFVPSQPSPIQQPSQQKKGKRTGKRSKQKNVGWSEQQQSVSTDSHLDYLDDGEIVAKAKKGKVSLNHLVVDEPRSNSRSMGTSKQQNRPQKSQGSFGFIRNEAESHPPTDKQTYINTTCRFVLDPRAKELYNPLLLDPDVKVPMERVIRVISRPQPCPICLEEIPKAPRMLRCGHILCLPCLLRYAESFNPELVTGLEWERVKLECPLCFEIVKMGHVKPVSFATFDERFEIPKEGQDVVMNLMFRPIGSSFAAPISRLEDEIDMKWFENLPEMKEDDAVAPYSRLILGTRSYLENEFDREVQDLKTESEHEQLLYNDPTLTKCHKRAMIQIKSAKALLDQIFPEGLSNSIRKLSLNSASSIRKLDSFADDNAYYFYQTCFNSETKFFLSPLDVRILKAEFGGQYNMLPSSIVVHIDSVHHGTYAGAALRKRLKYTTNLPTGTSVAFVDGLWTSNPKSPGQVLSAPTIAQFSNDIMKRRNFKKERKRFENNQTLRIQQKEKHDLRDHLLSESGFDIGNPSGVEEEMRTVNEEYKRSMMEAPALPSASSLLSQKTGTTQRTTQTVWGTKIPESEGSSWTQEREEAENWFDIDALLQQGTKSKQRKKRR